jgi:sec-independent protein translocase protein TatA
MTPVFAIIDAPIIAIIAGLAILLFGADRLPKLARSMGEAKKEFESASRAQPSSTEAPPASSQPPPSNPPQTPAQPQ